MIPSIDSSNTNRVLSILCILIFIALAAGSCTEKPTDYFQGYVEGEYVLVSSPLAGRLDLLAVSRGQDVAMGDQLFILEHDREQARWKLEQKSQAAPAAGFVFDTFYREGEFVPAAYPVISLLPPDHVKIRFFVPETILDKLALGDKISVSLDGRGQAVQATISYISPQAEYTPPVIYSREIRAKLVYMIEAVPEPGAAAGLHPGQPVDVILEPSNG